MLTQDEIEEQKRLLDAHRKTLTILLLQRSKHTAAFVPPSTEHGILEARENIQRIKRFLQNLGVSVDTHPSDLPSNANLEFLANKSTFLNALTEQQQVLLIKIASRMITRKYSYEFFATKEFTHEFDEKFGLKRRYNGWSMMLYDSNYRLVERIAGFEEVDLIVLRDEGYMKLMDKYIDNEDGFESYKGALRPKAYEIIQALLKDEKSKNS